MSDCALDRVRQWELSGGSLRVLGLTSDQAVVQLCACTGEPMEVLVSDEPALLGYLRNEGTPGSRGCPAVPAAPPDRYG
ncbi:MAG: hypothetical protein JO023_06235 [Chloroflexi bacterium]|nr:hypothetical protein [Chloroflexota bacterium]